MNEPTADRRFVPSFVLPNSKSIFHACKTSSQATFESFVRKKSKRTKNVSLLKCRHITQHTHHHPLLLSTGKGSYVIVPVECLFSTKNILSRGWRANMRFYPHLRSVWEGSSYHRVWCQSWIIFPENWNVTHYFNRYIRSQRKRLSFKKMFISRDRLPIWLFSTSISA